LSVTTGTQFSSHEITARLGEGGMDVMFRARDRKLKRSAVIKTVPDEIA